MGFVANFVRFQQRTIFESRLRFDTATNSLKVGSFWDTAYVTLWNINGKKQNGTSQHSLTMWFRCGLTFTLLQICRWVSFKQSFEIVQHLAKYGEKLIASSALFAGAVSCWKMKNSLEIWRMVSRNCGNSITIWSILLTDLDYVIDKCQSGAVSTTCHSLTDAISDWKLIVRADVLSRRLSSWLTDVRKISHSVGVFLLWPL